MAYNDLRSKSVRLFACVSVCAHVYRRPYDLLFDSTAADHLCTAASRRSSRYPTNIRVYQAIRRPACDLRVALRRLLRATSSSSLPASFYHYASMNDTLANCVTGHQQDPLAFSVCRIHVHLVFLHIFLSFFF